MTRSSLVYPTNYRTAVAETGRLTDAIEEIAGIAIKNHGRTAVLTPASPITRGTLTLLTIHGMGMIGADVTALDEATDLTSITRGSA